MKAFQASQILVDVTSVKDQPTRVTLSALAARLTAIFRDISMMPFNRSQTAIVADSGAADTEFQVAHSLGRVPVGYIVTSIDRAGSVYNGTSSNTDSEMYLRCSVSNAAITIQVF